MSARSEPVLVHRLKNQLTIILGFADLLIRDVESSDRGRLDAIEIRKAATTALELLAGGALGGGDQDSVT